MNRINAPVTSKTCCSAEIKPGDMIKHCPMAAKFEETLRLLKTMLVFTVLVLGAEGIVSTVLAATSDGQLWNFDQDQIGTDGEGFNGEVGRWEIVEDATAPSKDHVLAQLAKNISSAFNVTLVSDANLQDVDVSVSFKAIGGTIDQGGGLVWRAMDVNNYYTARYNPLEDNYRVYKVVNGSRTELGSADFGPSQGWHDLRVIMIGDHIQGFYDSQKYLDVHDNTFEGPGKVGLWTKADALTHFDDFHARAAQTALLWESSYTSIMPEIDGELDEVWERSKPLMVEVREAVGGHNPRTVVLRALHTDDRVFVLAQWPDVTRSDMRDPYIWNATQNLYERPSKPDDQFALEFPLSGDFDVSMLALSQDYTADVWHWKAGRGNPVGWVDDKRHIISQTPFENALPYSMGGRGMVYIARPLDGGTPSYRLKDAPQQFTVEVVDSFLSQTPSDSLADVRGKGKHDGKAWTLEMTRLFNTSHEDDTKLDADEEILCAIAVLDDELYWQHSVSPLIELRFLPKTTPPQ